MNASDGADRRTVLQWREQSYRRNEWRRDSARAFEYFDGNQFDLELIEKYKAADLPLLVENCIRRWVSTAIGREATQMTDGVIRVEDNRYETFAEGMSSKLKEAERVSRTDIACVTAIASAYKGGIGWVEVGDPIDVFAPPHRVESMPWRELWWDMTDRSPGLQEAEWFNRIKMVKRVAAMAAFPKQEELIKIAGTTLDGLPWEENELYERQVIYRRDPNAWTSPDDQDMVTINEFRYRKWVNGYVYDGPNGPIMFDEENEQQLQLYYTGAVDPYPARFRRVRRSYWTGPHLLSDQWLNLPSNEIGWVPFVYQFEERTGVPYGMVRDMITLQDEINMRKAKASVALDNVTLIGDDDRVMDWSEARKAVARRRGVIRLDPTKPRGRFELDRHEGVTSQNLEFYQLAKDSIGYVHGLDAPFAGTPNSKSQSGVAIEKLVQQSATALGMQQMNFMDSRRRVLNLLLGRVVDTIGSKPTEIRYNRRADNAAKRVMLNVPVQLSDGTVEVLDPRSIKSVLVLDDVPSTTTYRQQQFAVIVETLAAMPPEAQMMLLPAMFELSELPNRQMYADMARKQLGLGEPRNEQEAAEAEQQKQMEAIAQQLQQMAIEVKIAREQAAASLAAAQTQKVAVETEAIKQDIRHQELVLAQGPTEAPQPVLRW